DDLMVAWQTVHVVVQSDEAHDGVLRELDPEQAQPEDAQDGREDDRCQEDKARDRHEQGKLTLAQPVESPRDSTRTSTDGRGPSRHDPGPSSERVSSDDDRVA